MAAEEGGLHRNPIQSAQLPRHAQHFEFGLEIQPIAGRISIAPVPMRIRRSIRSRDTSNSVSSLMSRNARALFRMPPWAAIS